MKVYQCPNCATSMEIDSTAKPSSTDDAQRRLVAAAGRMYNWLKAHYQSEEGPGQTDRPQYAELRNILKQMEGQ